MKRQILKYPDGQGGFILKTQDDDGIMHLCDEKGNYIEEPAPEKPTRMTGAGKNEVPREATAAKHQSSASDSIRFNFIARGRTGRLITEYCLWYFHSHQKRIKYTDLFVKAVTAYIKKDTGFQEYLKKQSE